jgi:hypothetical protein
LSIFLALLTLATVVLLPMLLAFQHCLCLPANAVDVGGQQPFGMLNMSRSAPAVQQLCWQAAAQEYS